MNVSTANLTTSPFAKVLLCALMGALCYFCFAPLYLWFLLPVFLGVLMSLCKQQKVWLGFLYGYAFGYAYYATHFYWIKITVQYFNEDAFAFISLFPSLYLGLYAGLAGAAFSVISKYSKPLLFPFLFSLCWTIGEVLLTTVSYGLPWNLIGYTTTFSLTLMQAASLGSIFLLSFLVVLVSCCTFSIYKNKRFIPVTAIILIAWAGFGTYRLQTTTTEYAVNTPTVRVVQTGITLNDKDAHTPLAFIKKNKGLMRADGLENVHLVIWPEWGTPTYLKEDNVIERFITEPLHEDQYLITGTSDRNEKIDYNALALIQKNQKPQMYHKNILVPFSEFVPFQRWLPDFATTVKDKLNKSFGHGATPPLMRTSQLSFTPLICFEAVYPLFVSTYAKHSDVLIQISNDYWLDQSYAEAQLFAMSRVRTIETGLPLIRSANTGTSAMIDGYGRIIYESEKHFPDVFDEMVPSKTKTPTVWMSLFGFYK